MRRLGMHNGWQKSETRGGWSFLEFQAGSHVMLADKESVFLLFSYWKETCAIFIDFLADKVKS